MITIEQFTALAHRTASRYSHRSEPARAFYTFSPEALANFHRQVCAAVEAAQDQRAPDWNAFEQAVQEYVEDYEMIGETEDGRDACYTPNENDKALLLDAFMGFDFSPWLLASTPAPAQQSGWTEESGLVLEAANRVEMACYDQGSAECMAAVQEILDGKDRGDGVANEPWESIRRRLIALVAPAPAQQEPAKPMDAHRAAFFMRRFLHEEKMLGPNEQAALHFTIAALEAMESAAQHQEPPQQESETLIAAKAKAFDWLMANRIADEAGWLVLRYETSRQNKHPDESKWVASDILWEVGVDLEEAASAPAAQHQEPPQQERTVIGYVPMSAVEETPLDGYVPVYGIKE